MWNEIHCPVNFDYPIRMPKLIHFHAYRTWTSIHFHLYQIAKSNGIHYPESLGCRMSMLTSNHYPACQRLRLTSIRFLPYRILILIHFLAYQT